MKKICMVLVLAIVLASNSFIASSIEKIWPTLINAVNNGDLDRVTSLVPQFIHADEKTRGGKTLFEHALLAKQPEVVEYLISTIDLNHLLSSLSHGELLDILIPAIELGQLTIVQAIIPEKISPEERSKGGRTFLAIAQNKQQQHIATYFESLLPPSANAQPDQQTLRKKEQITFYYPDQDYYELSNFYQSPFVINNTEWPTVEHFFQAQKFPDPTTQETIRTLKTPEEAYQYGRDPQRRKYMNSDWNTIKEKIMHQGLFAKFSQNENLKQLLIDTGDTELIQASPRDASWGWGPDHQGQNKLGTLLMQVREELKSGL